MKKALLLVGVLALALGISYLVLHKSSSGSGRPEQRDEPLTVSSKTSAFNRSFAAVLNSYYMLAEAFTVSDSSGISTACRKLSFTIDSIRFDQIRADTAIVETAVSLAQSIQGDIKGLTGEKTLEQKKREFNIITDELYSLIRTVRYDGSIIYHMRSPVAFADSSEAYWLSPSNKIINPYLGENNPVYKANMPEYGELIDSIHFSAPASE
jgi:hypothetical protein